MKRRLLSIALVFIVLFTFLDVHSFADESISDESTGVIENEKIEEVLGAEDESDADTINSEFSKEDDGLNRISSYSKW